MVGCQVWSLYTEQVSYQSCMRSTSRTGQSDRVSKVWARNLVMVAGSMIFHHSLSSFIDFIGWVTCCACQQLEYFILAYFSFFSCWIKTTRRSINDVKTWNEEIHCGFRSECYHMTPRCLDSERPASQLAGNIEGYNKIREKWCVAILLNQNDRKIYVCTVRLYSLY